MDDLFDKMNIDEAFLKDILRKACAYKYAECLVLSNTDYSVYDKMLTEYTDSLYEEDRLENLILQYKELISKSTLDTVWDGTFS